MALTQFTALIHRCMLLAVSSCLLQVSIAANPPPNTAL